jgi:hypothetical protein
LPFSLSVLPAERLCDEQDHHQNGDPYDGQSEGALGFNQLNLIFVRGFPFATRLTDYSDG